MGRLRHLAEIVLLMAPCACFGATSFREPIQGILSEFQVSATGEVNAPSLLLPNETVSRLLAVDANGLADSVTDLTAWIAGTGSEIDIADDGDGTITIGLVDPLAASKGGTGQDSSAWTGLTRVDAGTWSVGELSGDVATSGSNVTVIQPDSVALGTDTTGNYVASLTEGLAIDVGASGEGATPSVAFDPTELTGSRTFGDASTDTIVWTFDRATGTDPTITFNSGSIALPALTLTTDLAVTEGGTGASSLNDLITLTTHTTGNYVASVADGTGIDGTASGEGATYTPTLDLTEINSATFGDGSFTTLTFDAGVTDPVWTYSSGVANLSTGTLQEGGSDVATAGDHLGFFSATTSAQLAGVVSDETGSGSLVFATSPTFVTPALGTPASGNLDNCTSTDWDAAYTHVSSNGSDHTYIDQDVTTTGTPSFTSLSLGTGELTAGSINRASGTLTLEIGGTAEASITSSAMTLAGNLVVDAGTASFGDGTQGVISTDTSGHRLAFSRNGVSHINAMHANGYLSFGTAGADGKMTLSTLGNIDIGNSEIQLGSVNRSSGTLTLEIGGTAILSLTSTKATFDQEVFITDIKSGATQGGAGAAADELWVTSSHASLPDNVVMIGI